MFYFYLDMRLLGTMIRALTILPGISMKKVNFRLTELFQNILFFRNRMSAPDIMLLGLISPCDAPQNDTRPLTVKSI